MLERLDEAIDALNAVDLASLDDASLDDLVVGLRERCSRLAAAEARLLARWDARMVWADDGSKAAGARLARDTETCTRTAYGPLRRARRLSAMPVVADAFRTGALSADVVDLLVRVNVPRRR